MDVSEHCDRQALLQAVASNAAARRWAVETCQNDFEIVLTAVRQEGKAIQWASERCKCDREIVMAAVNQDGNALEWAADACRSDREIVLTAVKQTWHALNWTADELVEDRNFAIEVKKCGYLLKITMMSGRTTLITSGFYEFARDVVQRCCFKLGVAYRGNEQLYSGSTVVPAGCYACQWPGIQPLGEITEYQLVVM
mmetsp:Transcript_10478/g.18927  ORF Transcript_10478/g.18927 Transcript_10478/m.18927 type:complete len:197 (+) Transcript_10478:21-611(+)